MQRKVFLKARNGDQTPGEVTVEEWTKPERLKRSLKFWSYCWAAAIVSIFLPAAHFVLVPLFFIGGPFVARHTYKQESIIKEGSGICPYCKEKVKIGRGPESWPIEELCVKCQNNISVVLL